MVDLLWMPYDAALDHDTGSSACYHSGPDWIPHASPGQLRNGVVGSYCGAVLVHKLELHVHRYCGDDDKLGNTVANIDHRLE